NVRIAPSSGKFGKIVVFARCPRKASSNNAGQVAVARLEPPFQGSQFRGGLHRPILKRISKQALASECGRDQRPRTLSYLRALLSRELCTCLCLDKNLMPDLLRS